MRILLDECLPKRLKDDLPGHDVSSVPEMGWAGTKNGGLLTLAQASFDIFLTVDRNLSFQQDVNKFDIAVVVLAARSNKYSDLNLLMSEVELVLPALSPGQVVRIGGQVET